MENNQILEQTGFWQRFANAFGLVFNNLKLLLYPLIFGVLLFGYLTFFIFLFVWLLSFLVYYVNNFRIAFIIALFIFYIPLLLGGIYYFICLVLSLDDIVKKGNFALGSVMTRGFKYIGKYIIISLRIFVYMILPFLVMIIGFFVLSKGLYGSPFTGREVELLPLIIGMIIFATGIVWFVMRIFNVLFSVYAGILEDKSSMQSFEYSLKLLKVARGNTIWSVIGFNILLWAILIFAMWIISGATGIQMYQEKNDYKQNNSLLYMADQDVMNEDEEITTPQFIQEMFFSFLEAVGGVVVIAFMYILYIQNKRKLEEQGKEEMPLQENNPEKV